MKDLPIADALQQYAPFWNDLTPQEQQRMLMRASRTTRPKGQMISTPGETCMGLVLIEQGTLRISMLSPDGREITLYRLQAGDICVLSASCVLQSIAFEVWIQAEEDCRWIGVPSDIVRDISESNAAFRAYLYELATERFSDVMWGMQQILFLRADARLASVLLDAAVREGNDTVSLSHEELARDMGSAREVVTRLLRQFAADGLVEVARKKIRILDEKKLRALASQGQL